MAKISIGVPVYNTEKYLKKCLDSLVDQTFKDIEIIIVDDCSPDNSASIIKEYQQKDNRIVYIKNNTNRGSNKSKETALKNATGEYIIFVDSDDWCENTMLEAMYNTSIENNADIVVADYFVQHKNYTQHIQQPVFLNFDGVDQLLKGSLHGSLCNKLVHRSLYTIHNISFVKNIQLWEDLVVCIKLFSYAKIVSYIPLPFLHYVQQPNSITHTKSDVYCNNVIDSIKEIEHFLIERDIANMFVESLIYRKLWAKLYLLQNAPKNSQKKFHTLYPETTPFIFSNLAMPFYYRLALKCATQGYLIICNAIFVMLIFLKFIIRR